MCGRFYVPADDAPEDLARLLRQIRHTSRGEVRPGDVAAAVAPARDSGRPKPFAMRWGFPLSDKLVINARSESAAQRPMFRDSWKQRRCLIPASAWFEWDHRSSPMVRNRFQPAGTQWFYLAGLYRVDEGGEARFSVLTRQAVEALAPLHDRMPVVFRPDAAEAWLDPRQDPAELLPEALTDIRFAPDMDQNQPQQLSFLES